MRGWGLGWGLGWSWGMGLTWHGNVWRAPMAAAARQAHLRAGCCVLHHYASDAHMRACSTVLSRARHPSYGPCLMPALPACLSFLPSLREQNPDPKAHAYFRDYVAKAYEALTDEVARNNWMKHGHPDGPQVRARMRVHART